MQLRRVIPFFAVVNKTRYTIIEYFLFRAPRPLILKKKGCLTML